MMNLHANLATINGTAERLSALPFLTNNLMEQVMADERVAKRVRAWKASPEILEKIVAMYLDGSSVEVASKAFGYTPIVGSRALKERGIVPRKKPIKTDLSKPFNRWNPVPEEIEKQVVDFYLECRSPRKTEEKFGVCIDPILRRHAIPRLGQQPKVVVGLEDKIVELYLSGLGASTITKKLKVSTNAVYDLLKKREITIRPLKGTRRKSQEKESAVIDCYLSGIAAENVGKKFGLCEATILYVLRKNNVVIRPPGGVGEKCSNWKGGINSDKKYRRERHNKYRNARRKTDPLYKLNAVLRSRISTFFRRNLIRQQRKVSKWNTSVVLLGASVDVIKNHLEMQFKDGMTWKNHGTYWHIDHIIPLAAAKTKEELEKLFHYKNLQPLEAKENQRKNACLDWPSKKEGVQ